MSTSLTSNETAASTDKPIGLSIENLPIEIFYHHIFDFLCIDDVIALKLVSKKFRSLIDNLNVQELLIQSTRYKDFWISINKPVQFNNILSDKNFHLLFKLPIFLNLKRLQIDLREKEIKLDDFNKFMKLEIFEINLIEKHESGKHLLQLPNLKAFALGIYTESPDDFVIDTPNLEHLQLHSWEKIQLEDRVRFVYPLSVKRLRILYFDKKISIFKNLEYLEYSDIESIKMNQLLELDNLKMVRILGGPIANKLDQLRTSLFYQNKMKMSLKGVLIKETSKLDEYKKINNNLKFQLTNFDDLENNLNYETEIQYDDLINLLPKPRPIDLFRKYCNIRKLLVSTATDDENQLIDFIRECRNLAFLDIQNSKIGQHFYDRLPEISTLFNLKIRECGDRDVDLDFRFIMRMYYLFSLQTDFKVKIDKNLDLNKLKFLESLEYKIKGDPVTIYKENTDAYWENLESDYLSMFNPYKKSITFATLVEWCEFVEEAKKNKGIICPSVKFHHK